MAPYTQWLMCEASAGQFSGEVAVSGSDSQGHPFSLFVAVANVEFDADLIAGKSVDKHARVKVTVIDENDGLKLVRLPGRTFENGSTVTVSAHQLQSAEITHT
jgi:hypothetical protein